VPIEPVAQLLSPLDLPFRDGYVWSIIYVSLYVSVTAVALSTLFSVPVAVVVGFSEFPGKRVVKSVVNTGMGFPSVVVGLLVLFAVSNQGPLGSLELVFTRGDDHVAVRTRDAADHGDQPRGRLRG